MLVAMACATAPALAHTTLQARFALPVTRRVIDGPRMLDAPAALGVVLFAGTAVALTNLADDSAEEEVDSATRIAALQSRIQTARTSSAITYREVEVDPTTTADAGPADPDALKRREEVLSRAQEMLDGARLALQDGLDEAVRNQDYDTAEEYLEMLEKMKPLPPGIDYASPPPGYKRWLESSPRRA